MNSITNEGDVTMIDRADVSEVIYRVSVAAFAHYPYKPAAEAGYTVEEDVDWAIEPVPELDGPVLADLRDRVRDAILDVGGIDRQAFIRHVKRLAVEG